MCVRCSNLPHEFTLPALSDAPPFTTQAPSSSARLLRPALRLAAWLAALEAAALRRFTPFKRRPHCAGA